MSHKIAKNIVHVVKTPLEFRKLTSRGNPASSNDLWAVMPDKTTSEDIKPISVHPTKKEALDEQEKIQGEAASKKASKQQSKWYTPEKAVEIAWEMRKGN